MEPGPVVGIVKPQGEPEEPQEEVQEQTQEETQGEAQASQEQAAAAVEEKPEGAADEESGAVRINKLLDEGYSPRQVKENFGFSRQAVETEIKNRTKPEGKPVFNKNGPLVEAVVGNGKPVKLGRYEVVAPESVLQASHLPDGEYRAGYLDALSMITGTARLLQVLGEAQANQIKPVVDMLSALRQEEKVAAEQARGTGQAIAQEAARDAAQGAAGAAIQYLEDKKPWLAASPDPMKAMFADVMRPMLENVMKSLTPGAEGEAGAPAGFTRRKETGDD